MVSTRSRMQLTAHCSLTPQGASAKPDEGFSIGATRSTVRSLTLAWSSQSFAPPGDDVRNPPGSPSPLPLVSMEPRRSLVTVLRGRDALKAVPVIEDLERRADVVVAGLQHGAGAGAQGGLDGGLAIEARIASPGAPPFRIADGRDGRIERDAGAARQREDLVWTGDDAASEADDDR